MTIHQINTELTSIQFIKENINLARRLIGSPQKNVIPFDPDNTLPFYKGRAKHLQTMTILGITMEHLLKLIVSKRGYSILEIDYIKNVDKNTKAK